MKWFKSSQKSKALKNCRLSFALKSWNSNSGFSLVGVMVASAVGLVVVVSINQLFVQFSSRLSLQEDRYKQNLFQTYLVEVLSDPTACLNTLGAITLDSSNEGSVTEIKDSGGTTLIDFFTPAGQERLEKEFGIDSFRELKFQDYDATTNEATLNLITTSMLHSTIPVYNKTAVFTIKPVTVTGSAVTNCQVVGVLGVSGGGGTPPNCSNVTDASDDKKTLIGCGGTINITAAEVTAIGYEAGGSTTGAHNTFMGFEAGKSSTSGTDNTFIGYQAGETNTSSGRNTFVGSFAGDSNTGSNNTFLGYESGRFSTSSNNTFVGYQAGTDNTLGANNAFMGHQAGVSVTTGSNNTFIGYQTGDTIFTGSNNTLIGHSAGSSLSSSSSNNIIIRAGSNQRTLSSSPLISENDKPGDNNILIGSFSKEKQKELAEKSNFLWIQGLIEGNAKEKWVSIQHDLDAKNLYASLHSLSDKRLKTEITKLDRSLETINQFKAYRFKWKEAIGEEKTKNHFGFMAQEVKTLTPEVVEENRKGFLTVNYPELVPLIVSAFQEFQIKIKNQLAKITKDLSEIKTLVTDQLKALDLKFQKQTKNLKESFAKQVLEMKTGLQTRINKIQTEVLKKLNVTVKVAEKNKQTLGVLNTQTLNMEQTAKNNKTEIDKLSVKITGTKNIFSQQQKELQETRKQLVQTETQLKQYEQKLKTVEGKVKELLKLKKANVSSAKKSITTP